MTRFDECVEVIFDIEGGYVNDPDDPGGATNMGITIGTLSAWRKRTVTAYEVRLLKKEEAKLIYKANYWDKCGAVHFRPGVDLIVFSGAVHTGPARAVRFLQSVIGAVVDGVVGPETRWKASQMDPVDIISQYADMRLAHMRDLPTWWKYGEGWTNRVNRVEADAIKMARADGAPVPIAGTQQDGRLLRAYRLATAELGTREISGAQHNPEIVQWFADVGHQWVRDDETAWCAAFLGAMLEAAGLESTRKLNARSYMDWGESTNSPKEGDIAVFWRVSKSDWRGHVGFVVEVDTAGRRVKVLGGNQSDSVSEKWYPMNANTYGLLGYRTLKAEAPPKPEQPETPSMEISKLQPYVRNLIRVAAGAVGGAGFLAQNPELEQILIGAAMWGIAEVWYWWSKRSGGPT